jgi:hypothetical protein
MRYALLLAVVAAFEGIAQGADGGWKLHETVDKMTDAKTSMLVRESEEGGQMLTILCSEGRVGLAVNWKNFISLDERTSITQRLGPKPATKMEWILTEDHKTTLHPDLIGDGAKRYVEEIATVPHLLLRSSPHGEGYETAEFKMTGLAERLAAISCFAR